MTDTKQSAVATLRELLPVIETGEGALDVEDRIRLVCGLFGAKYRPPYQVFTTGENAHLQRWCGRLANFDLQAADDLVREVLPGFRNRQTDVFADGSAYCCISVPKDENYSYFYEGEHPTDERRAIVAALVRARIAELEAKDVAL